MRGRPPHSQGTVASLLILITFCRLLQLNTSHSLASPTQLTFKIQVFTKANAGTLHISGTGNTQAGLIKLCYRLINTSQWKTLSEWQCPGNLLAFRPVVELGRRSRTAELQGWLPNYASLHANTCTQRRYTSMGISVNMQEATLVLYDKMR